MDVSLSRWVLCFFLTAAAVSFLFTQAWPILFLAI
jgi:hypothetical protein